MEGGGLKIDGGGWRIDDCILDIGSKDGEEFHISTNLYFIGNKWKKWKKKFNKMVDKYNQSKLKTKINLN